MHFQPLLLLLLLTLYCIALTAIPDLFYSPIEYPFITEQPRDRVIALSDSQTSQNSEFRCEARGEPLPKIEWFHNSKNVKDSEKYSISSPSMQTSTGDFIVTSTLTINNLTAIDGGEVKCVVMVEDGKLPGVEFEPASATALLAVIGM